MEAILEGELEKGKNPLSTSSKDWRPMLFVLKRTSGVPMLYYYRDTKKRWQKQTAKGVVVLSPWFHVSIAHECSYKFGFTIRYPEGILYLAAKDNDTMNHWLGSIQAQMTLNTKEGDDCYNVEAIPSDDMSKIQAKGKLILKLSPDEIKLAQAGSLAMVASWPLNSLRRYCSENGIFTIEMGRRSPRGAGLYTFKTAQDGELFDKVQLLITKVASAPQNTLVNKQSAVNDYVLKGDDTATASTFGYDIDNRPPAPLPLTSYPAPPLPPKDNALDDVDSGGIRLGYGSVTKAQLQHQQQTLLKQSSTVQLQGGETSSAYDFTEHRVDAKHKAEDTNPDPSGHIYDVLKHNMGPLVAPAKPDLSAYNTVHIKEHNNPSVPQDTTQYDLAFPNSNTDSSNQQPVSNPVYSLGGLSNNPMYGTSADVEEVKQSLENAEQTQKDTFTAAVNGQPDNSEFENSDDKPPPIPPQNF